MPPKPASPLKNRTLSAFFTRDDAATENGGGAKEETTAPSPSHPATKTTASRENITPPSQPTPQKQGGRRKTKKADQDPSAPAAAAAPTSESTAPNSSPRKARSKKEPKQEVFATVNIPLFTPPSTGSPRKSKKQTPASPTSTKQDQTSGQQKRSKSSLAFVSTQGSQPAATAATVTTSSTLDSTDVSVKSDVHPKDQPTNTTSIASPSTNTPGATATLPNAISTSTTTATTAPLTNLSRLNKTDTLSMFRVRNGKAFITENKLKFSSHPSAIADLCRFHEYRERLQEATLEEIAANPGIRLESDHVEITAIPEDHFPLIAKFVEEGELLPAEMAVAFMPTLCPLGFEAFTEFASSLNSLDDTESMEVDKTEEVVEPRASLALDPENEKSTRKTATTISTSAIVDAIQAITRRINYGVPVSSLPGHAHSTPANLSIFRLEVQDIERFFPLDMRAAVVNRRRKRMEASAALTAWFIGLDAVQQEELCPAPLLPPPGPAPGATGPEKAGAMEVDGEAMAVAVDTSTSAGANQVAESEGVASGVAHTALGTVEAGVDPALVEAKLREAEAKKKEAEAREERRLEKERKMAERQVEKDLREAGKLMKEEAKKRKEEAERLKKEQTAKMFAGFFKPAPSSAPKRENFSTLSSEFNASAMSELFHPFHVKKYTSVAPINRFARDVPLALEFERQIGVETDAHDLPSAGGSDMDVDHEHVESRDGFKVPHAAPKSVAYSTLKGLLPGRTKVTIRNVGHPNSRSAAQYRGMTVKELINSGFLLQNEQDDLQQVLTWKEIPALRMRLMQFAENYRPAYYGTWSKKSTRVTGRRAFGKDTDLIDYDFDSEAEWEGDEEGEELKSDDDEDDADEIGSDQEEEDDWLVPEGYLSEDEGLDAGEEGGSKSESNAQKKSKDVRRPTLANLVPVIVGPVFEVTLAEPSSHPSLEPYHIEFIGDYGMGMDLFHATETAGVV
ncbi:Chromatin assembly factor 1, subunit A [Lunasporangiospora selenospora]|uniref:Chromatin assembly factor 1, subunit A n=1 Tax=Lunasporangiospora selenospora TaxID=979761 RepID=A0A9P6KG01_9FUNG|nr:Chromatin assembly factor 1, subunit A [Lunasporangiospora selenospora]